MKRSQESFLPSWPFPCYPCRLLHARPLNLPLLLLPPSRKVPLPLLA